MAASQFSYLLLLLIGFSTVCLLTLGRFPAKALAGKRFSTLTLCLVVLWLGVDQLAIEHQIWFFPDHGTLPVRIFRVPLEEILFLVLHTVACALLLHDAAINDR